MDYKGGMVFKENKQALYFNMILGTIGTILIALAAMRYLVKEYDIIRIRIYTFWFYINDWLYHLLREKSRNK